MLSGSRARARARSRPPSRRCSPAPASPSYADAFVWWKALLALVVALALQVGVNYANDYSDGIRGTDADRVGPLRLVGSGAGAAGRRQAGRVRLLRRRRGRRAGARRDDGWWLLAVGAVGDRRRLVLHRRVTARTAIAGLGEVSVFVFFGLVAVIGHGLRADRGASALGRGLAGCGIGALACAILVANNLRDIPTDRRRASARWRCVMGDSGTRELFIVTAPARRSRSWSCSARTRRAWWAAGRPVGVCRCRCAGCSSSCARAPSGPPDPGAPRHRPDRARSTPSASSSAPRRRRT